MAAKRKKKNISQEILGEYLGVTVSTISRYENGQIEIPVSSLPLICKVCEIDMVDLFKPDEDSPVYKCLRGIIQYCPEPKKKSKSYEFMSDMVSYVAEPASIYRYMHMGDLDSETDRRTYKEKSIDQLAATQWEEIKIQAFKEAVGVIRMLEYTGCVERILSKMAEGLISYIMSISDKHLRKLIREYKKEQLNHTIDELWYYKQSHF